jgi:hypothetical protein
MDTMKDRGDDLLGLLLSELQAQLPKLEHIESGLQTELEGCYGRLPFVFDFDPEASSVRVYTTLPTPPGAGPEFLRWCLSMNALYWDVKVGIDARGMLLLLCDVDIERGVAPSAAAAAAARVLLGRVVAIGQLLDEDFVGYLLDNRLATPAQRTRWLAWKKK